MKKLFFVFLSFIFSFVSFASDRMIAVTILPQKYVTERIAGLGWKIISIVPESANPHVYEPKADMMRMISNSMAYFSLEEVLDEVWLKKILQVNKSLKIFRMDKGIEKIRMNNDDKHHGKKLFYDPHIWLSLENMKKIALNTRDALILLDPVNKLVYSKNCEDFIKEVDTFKKSIEISLKGKKNKSFLVFHPSWGYFAKDFGLNQVSIEFEGKEPSPKRLQKIIAFAKSKNIKVIFVQPQISSSTVETLAKELNAKVVKINPLEYNWLENMKNVSEKIAEGLE